MTTPAQWLTTSMVPDAPINQLEAAYTVGTAVKYYNVSKNYIIIKEHNGVMVRLPPISIARNKHTRDNTFAGIKNNTFVACVTYSGQLGEFWIELDRLGNLIRNDKATREDKILHDALKDATRNNRMTDPPTSPMTYRIWYHYDLTEQVTGIVGNHVSIYLKELNILMDVSHSGYISDTPHPVSTLGQTGIIEHQFSKEFEDSIITAYKLIDNEREDQLGNCYYYRIGREIIELKVTTDPRLRSGFNIVIQGAKDIDPLEVIHTPLPEAFDRYPLYHTKNEARYTGNGRDYGKLEIEERRNVVEERNHARKSLDLAHKAIDDMLASSQRRHNERLAMLNNQRKEDSLYRDRKQAIATARTKDISETIRNFTTLSGVMFGIVNLFSNLK